MERRSFSRLVPALPPALPPSASPRTARHQWRPRLQASRRPGFDTIFGAAETVSKHVAAATGGKFQISLFAAGEIVPTPGVLDAVRMVPSRWATLRQPLVYRQGPHAGLRHRHPFGLNSRQQNAWLMNGGGLDCCASSSGYNIYNIPGGNTGADGRLVPQEIKSIEDLKGLKFRIGGFAGQVLARLGVVPQQIPPADIATLERCH